jgi:hypothetical protein
MERMRLCKQRKVAGFKVWLYKKIKKRVSKVRLFRFFQNKYNFHETTFAY